MDILLYASYKNSTTTLGETGLIPTCTIWSVLKVSPYTKTEVISAQAMTEVGRGLYLYPLPSVTLSTHDYVGVAVTSSVDVIDQEVHMLRWDGAESHDTELSRLDIVLSTIPALVWAWARRTLTMTVAQVLSFIEDGDDLSVLRGDTLSIPLTGLGSITGRSKLLFTARKFKTKLDSDSVIQVEETLNMLYLMGSAPVEPIVAGDATLTVNDEDAGDITILIKPRASKEFVQGDYEYDVEVINTDESVYTKAEGTFTVRQDVTRAVS